MENPIKPPITWTDFEKIDMRTGTIVECEPFEGLRNPAYKLKVDFGALGILKTSAQIKDLYQPEDLISKQVIAVVNFPPKQIANFMSECLVMGVYARDGVNLLSPDLHSENGLKVG
jgi:tRNA-binding protein